MNFLSEFWAKVAGIAAVIVGLLAWRQKGISDAVGNEKVKTRVKDSIDHINKLEKEKEDVQTAREIETAVVQLDDRDVSTRLRAFRGPNNSDNA